MKDLKELISESLKDFNAPENYVVTYDGNKKCYAVIQTANYDNDNNYGEFAPDGVSVMLVEEKDLGTLAGFENDEIKLIKKLQVGQSETKFSITGVVVVRLK